MENRRGRASTQPPSKSRNQKILQVAKKMILAAKKAQQKVPVTEHTIKLYRNAACTGYSNADEGESRNPVDHSTKHLELKEGDTHAVYNYFCQMKLTNPNFFYLMDLDEEGRLRNVFWADARSRAAYSYFSDTVSIDTTNLANKYEIPLISFVRPICIIRLRLSWL